MRHRITGPLRLLGLVTALMRFAPSANAQLVCTGSNPGLGDQVWGTTFGPTELLNACGVTAVGYFSLVNDTGSLNTAVGLNALFANTSGADNSAFGANALYSNTTGTSNTASGYRALYSNTTGINNTAYGVSALSTNTTQGYNTAFGYSALAANTAGNSNAGFGSTALLANTTGVSNTAAGASALYANTSGSQNTGLGVAALYKSTTANNNNAVGYLTMYQNITGANNVAEGYEALYSNTSGSNNTALGYEAGYNSTTGTDNIYLNNQGVAAESQVMRLGTQGTSGTAGSGVIKAFIAGVYGVTASGGTAVYINSSGQLGTTTSSGRFKTDVRSMGAATEELSRLRPVTFKYKTDPAGPTQYGLIAEEVAVVYPELVVRGPDGRIDGVHYEELAPMLLNELQEQERKVSAVERGNTEQAATISAQAAEIRELKRQQEETRAALVALRASITTSRTASADEIANQAVAPTIATASSWRQ